MKDEDRRAAKNKEVKEAVRRRLRQVLSGLGGADDAVGEVTTVVSEVVQTVVGAVQIAMQKEEVQDVLASVNEAGAKVGDGAQDLKDKLGPKLAELKQELARKLASLKHELRPALAELREDLKEPAQTIRDAHLASSQNGKATLASSIKACVFDVFGTVVDWRNSVSREVAALAARHGRDDVDANAFAMQWRQLYGPSMQTVRESGKFLKLDVLHRMSLDTVLENFDWQLSEEDRVELNLAWHRLDGWPDTHEGLAQLRSQRIIATLSNGNISLMVDMARRSGWSWDAILGAEVAGHYKPDPEVRNHTAFR